MSSRLPVVSPDRGLGAHSLLRWLKFNFVGGIGIGVQVGALAFFRSVLQLEYLLATALAVEMAVIHNFLWHEHFTWRDRPAAGALQSLIRLAKFNAANGGVSLAGNLLIMWMLAGELHISYLIANLIAVALCSLANFLLSDRFVFNPGFSNSDFRVWPSFRVRP